MAVPTFYNTGTASVTNGDTTVAFSGAALGSDEFPTVIAGDLFLDPAQPEIPPQRIASIDYESEEAELAVGWPGTTMSADAYEVRFVGDVVRSTAQTRRLLEQLSVVQANGRGLFYRFSTSTTDADPDDGTLRFDNVTIGSATEMYIDDVDADGADVTGELTSWDDSSSTTKGRVWLRSIATPSTFHAFSVSGSIVDGTGYRKATLTHLGGSGAFAAGEEIMVSYQSNGDEVADAANIDFTPAGGIAASNVQDAIEELDTEKANKAGDTFTGNITVESTDAGATAGPEMILDRQSASPAAADLLGQVTFKGRDDGANATTYAKIRAALLDPTDTSEDARIDLLALIAGVETLIASFGPNLDLAVGQIKFPSTQNPSSDANTLDDYEEGTFTPTIVGTSTAGTGTYSTQTAHYIKIGGRVFFDIDLVWSGHDGTGNMKVGGLPFTSGARVSAVSLQCSNLTMAAALQGYVEASATTIALGTVATGAAFTALPIDTAATLRVSGSYSIV